MTELEQEIAHLHELQAKHRRNIRTLEEMLANYGLERPQCQRKEAKMDPITIIVMAVTQER